MPGGIPSNFPSIDLPGVDTKKSYIFTYPWLRWFQDTYQRLGSGVGFVSQTWTPTDASGAGLAFTSVSCAYISIGDLVFAYGTLTYPATANATAASIVLPIAAASGYGGVPSLVGSSVAFANGIVLKPTAGAATGSFRVQAADAAITNATLSGAVLTLMATYPLA